MPMTQQDIRQHYETEWKQRSDAATCATDLEYCSQIAADLIAATLESLIADCNIKVDGGRVLDVGSGSGRWVRFFLDRFIPRRIVAIDYAQASVDLLRRWFPPSTTTELDCRAIDVTADWFEMDERFDLINVQNVLYHIPEPDLYSRALRNLASVLADDGCIVFNDYMPRVAMRTNWMLARSRHLIEQEVKDASLRIVEIRPCKFFDSASMGVDGPEDGARGQLQRVWSRMEGLIQLDIDEGVKRFFLSLFGDLDRAVTAFCSEHIAPVDFPAGKFVVLRRSEVG